MQPVSSKMGFELAFLLTLTNFRQNKSFFKKNLFFNWNIIGLGFPGSSVVKNLPISIGDRV